MEFGDLQEVFRLLELREEYVAFIADLESELAYLKHFMDCKLCWEKAKMMVNRERGDDSWWSNLVGCSKRCHANDIARARVFRN